MAVEDKSLVDELRKRITELEGQVDGLLRSIGVIETIVRDAPFYCARKANSGRVHVAGNGKADVEG